MTFDPQDRNPWASEVDEAHHPMALQKASWQLMQAVDPIASLSGACPKYTANLFMADLLRTMHTVTLKEDVNNGTRDRIRNDLQFFKDLLNSMQLADSPAQRVN